MILPAHTLRFVKLLVLLSTAVMVAGCGKTLVFAERDGVNLAIRSNASSTPPLEVNFGLNRMIATIVPPAGESNGKPDGEAVSMFASFQVDNTLDAKEAPLKADLKISTQFASGVAAKAVASHPRTVSLLVNAEARAAGAAAGKEVVTKLNTIMEVISKPDGSLDEAALDKVITTAREQDPSAVPKGLNARLKERKTVGAIRDYLYRIEPTVNALFKAAQAKT